MRRCYVCGETKPLSDFGKSKIRKDGHQYECKKCRLESAKTYYENNKEKCLENSKKWIKKNPHKQKQYDLKKRYGITSEEYERLKTDQNNSCAICKQPLDQKRHTHVDHCHTTKKIRGILCNGCNLGIGHFKDSLEYLKNAIKYLQKHNNTTI